MIIANQKERGVLIVDDESAIRHALSSRLKQLGFTNVHCAEDGLRALTCLELEGPNIYVIVSDVVMPSMDGVKLAEFLTANYHHPTGIIYMSGFQDKKDEFELGNFSEGDILNFDFFSKPFSFHDLITRILQCGDLVFNRRISLSRYSIEQLSTRLDLIQNNIDNQLAQNATLIDRISKIPRSRSFLEEIGFEVVKAIVIAIFVVISLKAIDTAKVIDLFRQ